MKLIIAIILLLVTYNVDAQTSTQFWNNYSFYNPATSGLENKHFAAVSSREQFGVLTLTNVSANYNTRIKDSHGIGINYSYGESFLMRNQFASINYNYQIKFDNVKKHKLSFGVSVGIREGIIQQDFICPTCLPSSEPIKQRSVVPNINLGVAYINKNLLLGIGVTQLTEQKLNNFFQLRRWYSLLGSYNFVLSEKIEIKPQFLISTDFNFTSIDYNVLMFFKRKLWTGVSYSQGRTVSWMLGVDIKETVRIGYSFTQPYNKLANIQRWTHEIVLGLKIK